MNSDKAELLGDIVYGSQIILSDSMQQLELQDRLDIFDYIQHEKIDQGSQGVLVKGRRITWHIEEKVNDVRHGIKGVNLFIDLDCRPLV